MQQTMVKLSERLLFKRPLQLVSQTWYDSCLGAFTSPYYNSSNLHMRIIPSSTALENCPRWMLSSQLFCNSEMMKIPAGKKDSWVCSLWEIQRHFTWLFEYLWRQDNIPVSVFVHSSYQILVLLTSWIVFNWMTYTARWILMCTMMTILKADR